MTDLSPSPSRPSYFIIGLGCLLLLACLALILPEFRAIGKSISSLSWQKTDARIEKVSYDYVALAEGQAYRTRGQYRYEWDGQPHTSSQLFFSTSADNLGFHKKKYRELQQARRETKTVPVWVNPNHPDQAVLYRGIRFGLLGAKGILVGLFGTIGVALIIGSLALYRSEKAIDLYREQYPAQPWMWEKKWQTDHIMSVSKQEFRAGMVFAIVVSMIALSSASVIPREIANRNPLILLAFIPGIFAAWYGFKMFGFWRSMRFEKHMSFFLETRPAVLGKTLKGRLVLPNRYEPEDLSTTLVRKKIVRTKESDGTTFTKTDAHKVPGQITIGGITAEQRVFQINVDIPRSQDETSWGKDNTDSYWDLGFEMRVKGTPVSMRYEIPVADPTKYPALQS